MVALKDRSRESTVALPTSAIEYPDLSVLTQQISSVEATTDVCHYWKQTLDIKISVNKSWQLRFIYLEFFEVREDFFRKLFRLLGEPLEMDLEKGDFEVAE